MAFSMSMVIIVIVFSLVFRTNYSLETSSKTDNVYNSLDVPLVDSLLDAPLKAQLDISKLTKQLATLISYKVRKEVNHAYAELESLVENKTKEAEETLKTEIYNIYNKSTSGESGRVHECADIRADKDGKYAIFPSIRNQTVSVYCIMEQNKKWTVIQRRYNGSVAFSRNWSEYKHGFGNVEGEYWLGNDVIHSITQNGHHELSIYLIDSKGRLGRANYSTFSIGDETSQYVLRIAGYTGNVGDRLDKTLVGGMLNGMKFYTGDKKDSGGCATTARGGWWYKRCFDANLNRQYSRMNWDSWSSSIRQTIMMIRRV